MIERCITVHGNRNHGNAYGFVKGLFNMIEVNPGRKYQVATLRPEWVIKSMESHSGEFGEMTLSPTDHENIYDVVGPTVGK